MPKIKNILIFVAVGIILVLIYVFFVKQPTDGNSNSALVSSSGFSAVTNTVAGPTSSNVTQDFLNLLLSVKSIKLDAAIFSDVAFINLDGSHSINLIPDGNEGRPNPFAPIGSDNIVPPVSIITTGTDATGTTGQTGGLNTGTDATGAMTGLPILP